MLDSHEIYSYLHWLMLYCEIVPHSCRKSHMKVYICKKYMEGNHEIDDLGSLNEIIIITLWVATNTCIEAYL